MARMKATVSKDGVPRLSISVKHRVGRYKIINVLLREFQSCLTVHEIEREAFKWNRTSILKKMRRELEFDSAHVTMYDWDGEPEMFEQANWHAKQLVDQYFPELRKNKELTEKELR